MKWASDGNVYDRFEWAIAAMAMAAETPRRNEELLRSNTTGGLVADPAKDAAYNLREVRDLQKKVTKLKNEIATAKSDTEKSMQTAKVWYRLRGAEAKLKIDDLNKT